MHRRHARNPNLATIIPGQQLPSNDAMGCYGVRVERRWVPHMDTTLLILIPVAVLGIFGLNILMGYWGRQALPEQEALLARMRLERPGFEPGRLVVDAAGRAALIEEQTSGECFLVRGFGDRVVVTKLDPAHAHAEQLGQHSLAIRFDDITQPSLRLDLREADDAVFLAAKLGRADPTPTGQE